MSRWSVWGKEKSSGDVGGGEVHKARISVITPRIHVYTKTQKHKVGYESRGAETQSRTLLEEIVRRWRRRGKQASVASDREKK